MEQGKLGTMHLLGNGTGQILTGTSAMRSKEQFTTYEYVRMDNIFVVSIIEWVTEASH